ncbi:MAG: ABC transporter permease [Anaerolineae bacterium]|nr:ABC transporter permease [Anaerolineae bacterium]
MKSNNILRFINRLNFPMVLGAFLVGGLVFIAIAGQSIAPHDPMENFYIIEAENGEFITPPFAPGQVPGFPLGSDFDGRDILSRLLVGVRPTLILVTLVVFTRMIVGVVLGFAEGWYAGLPGDIIGHLTKIALSIPILIVALMVIYILELQMEAWVFIIALTITGWGQVARIIAERVRLVRGETYIEAARALGAGNLRILWKHVVPQVRTLILVTLSFEMGAVLLQMAELGFLGMFLGGGAIRLIPDPKSGGFFQEHITGQPELGQMLAAGWENFIYTPAMPAVVGTVFFLAVFSFMMLGEGLKRYYAEPTSSGLVARLRASGLVGPVMEGRQAYEGTRTLGIGD